MNQEVCVLIPHYNNPYGLSKSIKSIEEDVDVLIVDDGSSCLFKEEKIKKEFSTEGEIIFIYLKKNQGIEEALNTGLQYIERVKQYKFVARLDCGDICHHRRFKKQYEFFKKNEDVALLGSWANVLDLHDNFLFRVKPPLDNHSLRKKMYYNCMFIHPSIMFRLSVLEKIGYYPYDYDAAEDYAFCFKIMREFKTANIGEYLISYQIDPHSISAVKRRKQVLSRIKVIKDNFYFGLYPIFGLLRNYLLLFLPLKIINQLKRILKNK